MTPPLTVTWFVPVKHRDYDRMPASVWARCFQLHPYLERIGVRCIVNDRTARADVAVFVRWQDADALTLAREARGRGARVVFDLVVNYFDETGLVDGAGVARRHVDECLAMVGQADAVTASSAYTAQRARDFHPLVRYFPEAIDDRHFATVKTYETPPRQPLRAVWSGFGSKARYLDAVLPMLERRRMPLVVISEDKPRLSRPFEFVRWRHRTFPRELLRGDFCVAPRTLDSTYNLGHSFFKIGVFLAAGIPALAAPVPSYREVLVPERTGLFCESPAEWEAALDRLQEEPEILAAWSKEAREIMRPYLAEPMAEAYRRFFQELGAA